MNLWTLTEHAHLFNVRLPNTLWLSSLGIKTSKELREWVDKDSEKDSGVEFPEGYVVYWAGKPVAKVKNSRYLAAFHVSGGNRGHARNKIIELIFTGTLDDVYSMMIPELQEFANKIKEKVAEIGREVIETGKEIAKGNYPTQKDYALAIQKLCPTKTLHSFFYQNKNQVIAGQNLSELYTKWITENYERFMNLWKDND